MPVASMISATGPLPNDLAQRIIPGRATGLPQRTLSGTTGKLFNWSFFTNSIDPAAGASTVISAVSSIEVDDGSWAVTVAVLVKPSLSIWVCVTL